MANGYNITVYYNHNKNVKKIDKAIEDIVGAKAKDIETSRITNTRRLRFVGLSYEQAYAAYADLKRVRHFIDVVSNVLD